MSNLRRRRETRASSTLADASPRQEEKASHSISLHFRVVLPLSSALVILLAAYFYIFDIYFYPVHPRPLTLPMKSKWKPVGARKEGISGYNTIPEPKGSYNLGGNDQVWSVVGPVMKKAWCAEQHLYTPEAPVIDDAGNVYLSPLDPSENISLVALDVVQGHRKWTLAGDGSKAGAVLILNEPDSEGRQIIYHTNGQHLYAIRPTGKVMWKTQINMGNWDTGGHIKPLELHYHGLTDSLIGVIEGDVVFVADRATGLLLRQQEKSEKSLNSPSVRNTRDFSWVDLWKQDSIDSVSSHTHTCFFRGLTTFSVLSIRRTRCVFA